MDHTQTLDLRAAGGRLLERFHRYQMHNVQPQLRQENQESLDMDSLHQRVHLEKYPLVQSWTNRRNYLADWSRHHHSQEFRLPEKPRDQSCSARRQAAWLEEHQSERHSSTSSR